MEYGGLKPILPFFEGRSDAACRVVICLRRSRCCLRGVNGVEGGNPPNDLPAMPTVGAGINQSITSQCEDSPAHRHIRIPCHPQNPDFYHDAAPNCDAARCVATKTLPPYAHARPTPPYAHTMGSPHSPMSPWFSQRRGTPRRYGLRIIASA